MLRIAYLILAHTDPSHIARLVNKITELKNCDAYVHIDKKFDIEPFSELLKENTSVFFISDRIPVNWGAFSSVQATLTLLHEASKNKKYDRYVLLQGLDYPLKSNEEILHFFEKNKEIEFIRACKITGSNDKYHAQKCNQFWFFEDKTMIKRSINKISTFNPIKLRRGYVLEKKKLRYDICWGNAVWALTDNCVKYILDFSTKNKKFNKYFKHIFPPDETYFHTIIFNSPFVSKTIAKGLEEEKRGTVNWRTLHYFEYDGKAKIFNESDYNKVINSDCLFMRKVNSKQSNKLLDIIDELHKKEI